MAQHNYPLTAILICACFCFHSSAFSALPSLLSHAACDAPAFRCESLTMKNGKPDSGGHDQTAAVTTTKTLSLDQSKYFTHLELTDSDGEHASDRRSVLFRSASTVGVLLMSAPANAGIDPNALKAFKVDGDTTGTASRLRQIEAVNGPQPDDSKDIAFEVLPSGASFRKYREGKGDATVQKGSKVAVEMTIRAKSFATADEPGGRKYFSTKADTEFNELAWMIGSGDFPPDLEECMMGMRKGGVRRVELPSTAVFAAEKNNQLPSPSEKNKEGKRVYDRLFKTDATSLFEVLVTRIK